MNSIERKVLLYEQTQTKVDNLADYLVKRDFLLGHYLPGISLLNHCKAEAFEIISELGEINPESDKDRRRVNLQLFQFRGGDYTEDQIERILPMYSSEDQEHQFLTLRTAAYMHLCGKGNLSGEDLTYLYEVIPESVKNKVAWSNDNIDCSMIDTIVLNTASEKKEPIEEILLEVDDCHLLTLHSVYCTKEGLIYDAILKKINGSV